MSETKPLMLSPEEASRLKLPEDVWSVYGLGLTVMPFGAQALGLSDEASEEDKKLPVADRAVPPEARGKYKRHMVPGKFADAAEGPTHLLVLDYGAEASAAIDLKHGPVPPEMERKPFYFGSAKIDGYWALLWHDERTGKDMPIHCPTCVKNVLYHIMGMQEEWSDAHARRKSLH
jgi:hypothetical protein